MAYKTMLRQLISKWGVMSIDLQTAIEGDMAIISEDGTPHYVENDEDGVIDAGATEVTAPAEKVYDQQQAAPEPSSNISAALFG